MMDRSCEADNRVTDFDSHGNSESTDLKSMSFGSKILRLKAAMLDIFVPVRSSFLPSFFPTQADLSQIAEIYTRLW